MAIAVVSSLLLLGIFGIVVCCVWKRKKKVSGHNGGGYIMPTSIGSSPKSGKQLAFLILLNAWDYILSHPKVNSKCVYSDFFA